MFIRAALLVTTREVEGEVTSRANARASEAGDQVWKESTIARPSKFEFRQTKACRVCAAGDMEVL